MHSAAEHRRRGVAAGLLTTILDAARRRSYRRLSLETGSVEGFAPARALYSRFGFVETAPFGSYVADPNSIFMTLDLLSRTQTAAVAPDRRTKQEICRPPT